MHAAPAGRSPRNGDGKGDRPRSTSVGRDGKRRKVPQTPNNISVIPYARKGDIKGPDDVVIQHCTAFREGRERWHTTADFGLPHLTTEACRKKQKENWRDFYAKGAVPARSDWVVGDYDAYPGDDNI